VERCDYTNYTVRLYIQAKIQQNTPPYFWHKSWELYVYLIHRNNTIKEMVLTDL